jgi:hypothetical protein
MLLAIALGAPCAAALAHQSPEHESQNVAGNAMTAAGKKTVASTAPNQSHPTSSQQPLCMRNPQGVVHCIYLPGSSKH